ncbi:MAG: hypothetical protein GX221_10370 [Candidatus Riflebacteria bacterium]|nr:hypothetical protein [Candidatus Riflebacteria bacterium]
MENLRKTKITVLSSSDDFVSVVSEEGDEFLLEAKSQDLSTAEEGEEIEVIYVPASSPEIPARVIGTKKQFKKKLPSRINFGTMLKHMDKNKRMIEEMIPNIKDSSYLTEMQEKLEWLERGLELFQ